jgi:hypothetical protein
MCQQIGQIFAGFSRPIVILYLGDHDPSGLNISRVARRKIKRFSGRHLEWIRVAVNSTQFNQLKDRFGILTKKGDRLRPDYQAKHGNLCVEVDAMPSDEIRDRLETAIKKRIDMQIWKQTQTIEEGEQQQLEALLSEIRH